MLAHLDLIQSVCERLDDSAHGAHKQTVNVNSYAWVTLKERSSSAERVIRVIHVFWRSCREHAKVWLCTDSDAYINAMYMSKWLNCSAIWGICLRLDPRCDPVCWWKLQPFCGAPLSPCSSYSLWSNVVQMSEHEQVQDGQPSNYTISLQHISWLKG